jgi:hypothetical protein
MNIISQLQLCLRQIAEKVQRLYEAVTALALFVATDNLVTEDSTARTLILSDAEKYITCTHASGITITVPPNSSVSFPIGTEIIFRRSGGVITVVQGSGVTVTYFPNSLDVLVYTNFALKKISADEWHLI